MTESHTCSQADRITTLEVNSKNIMEKLDKMEIKIDSFDEKLDNIFDRFEKKLKEDYVSKEEFKPTKDKADDVYKAIVRVVVTVIGLVVTAIVLSVMK